MSTDELYTPEEVAEKLKLSKYTIYEMIKRGDILVHRIGRSIRISSDQLQTYILRAKGEENLYEVVIIETETEKFGSIGNVQVVVITELSGAAKISISPDDIILSKEKISCSARNMFKGTVTDIMVDGDTAKIKMEIGIPLITKITKRSMIEMNIAVGQELIAIFKATRVKVFK